MLGTFVWVIFDGHLPVGLLNILRGSIFGHAKRLVQALIVNLAATAATAPPWHASWEAIATWEATWKTSKKHTESFLPHSLYGLEWVLESPSGPVLLVEKREKTGLTITEQCVG